MARVGKTFFEKKPKEIPSTIVLKNQEIIIKKKYYKDNVDLICFYDYLMDDWGTKTNLKLTSTESTLKNCVSWQNKIKNNIALEELLLLALIKKNFRLHKGTIINLFNVNIKILQLKPSKNVSLHLKKVKKS